MTSPSSSFADSTQTSGAGRLTQRPRIGLVALLAGAFLLRLYRINAPSLDFLSWRETVTLMVARNFYRFGMNPFVPRVDWSVHSDAAAVNILGGSELMVTPFLTAALYHVFGIQDWVSRLVPIGFSLLGLFAFHRFAEALYGRTTAHVAAMLLMVSPYYLYCGRTQQPDSFAHAMVIVALYTFYRWNERPTFGRFGIAVAAAVAMMLGKPTMGVSAIPMAYLLWRRNGVRALTAPSTFAFGAAVGIPTIGYMYWSFIALDAHTNVTLGGEGWYFAHAKWLSDPGYYVHIARSLFLWSLTPIVALSALIGYARAIRQPAHRIGAAWLTGAMSVFVVIPGGAETNGYYQMIVEPPACLLAGAVLAGSLRRERGRWIGVVLLAAAVINSFYIAARLYRPVYASHVACGKWIEANTEKDTAILNAFQSTTVLYYADRAGWNSWLKSAGPHPVFSTALVEKAVANGADVVAVPYPQFDNSFLPDFDGVRDYLYSTYRSYKAPEFTVFTLNQPADLSLPPGGRVQFGQRHARKYLRGSVGLDFTLPDGTGFVPIGPGYGAAIEFEADPNLRRFELDIASTVSNHPVTIRINGQSEHQLTFDTANARMQFALAQPPPPVEGNRHTIEIVTTRKDSQGSGLVLFEMRALGAD